MFRAAASRIARQVAPSSRAMHALARPAAAIISRRATVAPAASSHGPHAVSLSAPFLTPIRCMSVQTITNDKDLVAAIDSAGSEKLVVVDWTASWCGPCRMIAPIYSALADSTPNVTFLKVDIDELQDASVEAGVQSVPTFHFIKNHELIAEFSGADQNKLKELVKKHA